MNQQTIPVRKIDKKIKKSIKQKELELTIKKEVRVCMQIPRCKK
jgi:hypothetical protein